MEIKDRRYFYLGIALIVVSLFFLVIDVALIVGQGGGPALALTIVFIVLLLISIAGSVVCFMVHFRADDEGVKFRIKGKTMKLRSYLSIDKVEPTKSGFAIIYKDKMRDTYRAKNAKEVVAYLNEALEVARDRENERLLAIAEEKKKARLAAKKGE